MKVETNNITRSLIYEMVDGNPIFFQGYKDFSLEESNFEEPLGSSLLQSMIISRLVILLNKFLGDQYSVLTNELGLQISKNNWRAADIAIFEKSNAIQLRTGGALALKDKINEIYRILG